MQKQNHQVILIRHGESKFNYMHDILQKLKKEKNLKENLNISEQLRFNKDYIDSPLTELGISQSEKLFSDALQQTEKIKIVLVSPLLRALQTAYHAFKNYKPQPWFIVVPELSEYMNTSNDIGMNTLEYKKLKEFKQFDFSQVEDIVNDQELWNISNLTNKEKQYTIQNILSMKCPSQKDIQKYGPPILVDYLKNNLLETPQDLNKRSQIVKQIINEYIKDYLQSEDEKLVIVSHAKMLQQFIPNKMANAQLQYWDSSNIHS